MKIVEIDVPDMFNNSVVDIKQTVDFDSMCMRLDFDETKVKQLEPGAKNGIQMRLQLPRAYAGVFDKSVVRRFPRKRHTFSGDMSKDVLDFAPVKVFNQEVFLMVHDKSLVMPTLTSPEVSVVYRMLESHGGFLKN